MTGNKKYISVENPHQEQIQVFLDENKNIGEINPEDPTIKKINPIWDFYDFKNPPKKDIDPELEVYTFNHNRGLAHQESQYIKKNLIKQKEEEINELEKEKGSLKENQEKNEATDTWNWYTLVNNWKNERYNELKASATYIFGGLASAIGFGYATSQHFSDEYSSLFGVLAVVTPILSWVAGENRRRSFKHNANEAIKQHNEKNNIIENLKKSHTMPYVAEGTMEKINKYRDFKSQDTSGYSTPNLSLINEDLQSEYMRIGRNAGRKEDEIKPSKLEQKTE